jgi:hypothetical protein
MKYLGGVSINFGKTTKFFQFCFINLVFYNRLNLNFEPQSHQSTRLI